MTANRQARRFCAAIVALMGIIDSFTRVVRAEGDQGAADSPERVLITDALEPAQEDATQLERDEVRLDANALAGALSPKGERMGAAGLEAPEKGVALPDGTPQVRALPTGGDKSGVSNKTISIPSGSGTIKGMEESFSAQLSTGIATFSVPFSLPSARGDAQPSLGLSYSSAGGFDLAGVGWSVGVPFIARQTDRGLPQYMDD